MADYLWADVSGPCFVRLLRFVPHHRQLDRLGRIHPNSLLLSGEASRWPALARTRLFEHVSLIFCASIYFSRSFVVDCTDCMNCHRQCTFTLVFLLFAFTPRSDEFLAVNWLASLCRFPVHTAVCGLFFLLVSGVILNL